MVRKRFSLDEVLRYAIAFALRRSRKIIRGLKEGLTEEERYAVADHAVAQLKERGDPWRLNDEAPTARPPSREDQGRPGLSLCSCDGPSASDTRSSRNGCGGKTIGHAGLVLLPFFDRAGQVLTTQLNVTHH